MRVIWVRICRSTTSSGVLDRRRTVNKTLPMDIVAACIHSIFDTLETLCCSHLTCVLCIPSMCLIVSGIMRDHFHFGFLPLSTSTHPFNHKG